MCKDALSSKPRRVFPSAFGANADSESMNGFNHVAGTRIAVSGSSRGTPTSQQVP